MFTNFRIKKFFNHWGKIDRHVFERKHLKQILKMKQVKMKCFFIVSLRFKSVFNWNSNCLDIVCKYKQQQKKNKVFLNINIFSLSWKNDINVLSLLKLFNWKDLKEMLRTINTNVYTTKNLHLFMVFVYFYYSFRYRYG